MVGERSIEVRTDIHALDPYLALVYHTVRVDQRRLAGAYRLDFRTREHHACRIGVYKEILKRGFLVSDLYGALLSYLLFLLVHVNLSFLIRLASPPCRSGRDARPHNGPHCR